MILPRNATKNAKPLLACIEKAARETGLSDHAVAVVMSHFFEELAAQVARGQAVRVPHFGVFAANTRVPTFGRRAGETVCYPAFSGVTAFRNAVYFECPKDGPGVNSIKRISKNQNALRTDDHPKASQRVFKSADLFRRDVVANARKNRVVLFGH